MKSITARRILNYFFRGLLILVPIVLTIYIIIGTLQWLDGLIPVDVPGLGLLIFIATIVLFGYLASTYIARPVFDYMEEILLSVPLISLIYSSIKDLLSAFVGDKKKFNQAVLVEMNPECSIQKLGFITQEDLSLLDLPGKVAVYMPHSYNFSGNLFIVPRERVTYVDLPGADVMKFIVSGGVSGISDIQLSKKHRENQLTTHQLNEVTAQNKVS